MKQAMLIFIFILSYFNIKAQHVKKVSINELENYIANSNTPLVVNFWATFCKPCIEELPYFFQSADRHTAVEILLVSLDLPDFYPAKVESFLKQKNFLKATAFWLDEVNADIFCPRIDSSWEGVMPVTLFVNNKKGFRKFVNRPMTEGQVKLAFEELVK